MQPRGESLRRAIRFVSDQIRAHENEAEPPGVMSFVNDAALRYDLNPNEAEYLIRFFRNLDPDGRGPESDLTDN